MTGQDRGPPSLESLVESGDLALEILHPGGLQITRELAQLCQIGRGTRVLDVASGTGESACDLAETFGARVVGVDASDPMLERAERKVRERQLGRVEFRKGDAQDLPFEDESFDAVISECTTCLLDKEKAILEMARVAKRGGYVGIHDLCWEEGAPEGVRRRLAEIEGERPETLEGWRALFERVGLREVQAIDRSHLVPEWMARSRRNLGLAGQARVLLKVLRSWGVGGLRRVWVSERIFRSEHMGYGILVGRKP